MSLEDFFEDKHKHYKGHNANNYYPSDSYNHNQHYYKHEKFNFFEFINSLRRRGKLKIFFILTIFVALLLIIGLIYLLLPLVVKAVDYIAQVGVSGLIDEIINYLQKLLNGA